MNHFTAFLYSLASQAEAGSAPPVNTESPLWPYIAAIGTLSTVVTALFGFLMRSGAKHTTLQESHAATIAALNKEHLAATDEKNKRDKEEIEKKDKVIVDSLTNFATLVERVAKELGQLNDSLNRRP